MWSCRFWAFYILLHFAHLREDKKLLEARQRTLRKGKGTSLNIEEKQDMCQKWDMFWSEVVTNLAYLPFSLHWCVTPSKLPKLCSQNNTFKVSGEGIIQR
jgi:hypothetical protein